MRRFRVLAGACITAAAVAGAGLYSGAQGDGRATVESNPKPAVATSVPREPTVTVLGAKEARGIVGTEIRSAANEDMGRIVDVIVDHAGSTRAAIIDFGGFLGVGNRRIAVGWNALKFAPATDGNRVALQLTRDEVNAAPEYKVDKPIVVLGPSGDLENLATP